MNKTGFLFLSVLLISILGCSSTTWIVETENQVDKSEYKLLDTKLFIQNVGTISPEMPLLQFSIKSTNTFEYAERVKTQRYIQKYRPRWGFVALGVGASSLAAYSALNLTDADNNLQQNTLFAASAALLGVSLINMKPIDAPRATGETRLLRKTGTSIQTDTLNASNVHTNSFRYSIKTSDYTFVDNVKADINGNSFSINLAEELNPDRFTQKENEKIIIDVIFNDSTYVYSVDLRSIYDPFVVVTSEVTALRNQPRTNTENVLTDLAKGSQLRLVEKQDKWIKVNYGISENYVASTDVQTIWRPSEFSRQLSVVAIPNVPFGSIDVERDIPRLSEDNRQRWGFIISNQTHAKDIQDNAYAHRDAQLVEKYMSTALGIVPSQIFKFLDVSGYQAASNGFSRLVSRINNRPAELVVYLNGYAKVDKTTDEIILIGTSEDEEASNINLNSLFDGLSQLPITKLSIVADLDFRDGSSKSNSLAVLSAIVTTKVPNSTIVFAADTNQRSYLYAEPKGVQKRHSIFTYFFANAIKDRKIEWSDIKSHLQRNVSFTSRSIFNAAQDIQFFGSDTLKLVE